MEQRIQEGDLVDIAYLKKTPSIHCVVWKHTLGETTGKKIANKTRKTKGKNEVIFSQDLFKEKQILVVGCEPRKSVYKQQVEQRGGVFYWANGKEGKKRLKAMIQKVDVVVLLIRFMGHGGSQGVVDLCKQLGVPFAVVESLGVQSLIDGVIQKTTA